MPFRARSDSVHPIAARLARELEKVSDCTSRSAIRGTLARLGKLALPSSGRVLVVNVAGRFLAAYRDGDPELESRVVVGREGWHTPDLVTSVASVTLNPTWTVPESIVRDEGWRTAISSDPTWADRNGFDVVLDGRRIAPDGAVPVQLAKATLVQRAGADNALGRMKISMRNAGSIYLHDTNAPETFGDPEEPGSHGCVRVELALELAAWVLDARNGEVPDLVATGATVVRTAVAPV
ncbi:L,D-transpeptidase family protein, partial [Methylobacterium hispanicum]